MADDKEWKGASFKEEADYTEAVDAALGKINATTVPVLLRASGSHLGTQSSGSSSGGAAPNTEALEKILEPLFALEKQARLGGDVPSCKRVAVEMLKIYRHLRLVDPMLQLMLDLMKKRAQSKQVQAAMVEECATVLQAPEGGSAASSSPLIPTQERREEVLERLAYATENKIHVELQHARFTAELATLHELKGQKQKAYDMLSTLQVETITNMPRVEKLHLLNQQIRLALELEGLEYIPTISRKISHRVFLREESVEEKLHYFTLMREFFTKKGLYFHVGRCWLETFLTLSPSQADQRLLAMRSAVVLYLIADYSTEKQLEDAGEFAAFTPATFFPHRAAVLQGLCENYRSDLEDVPQLHSLVKRFNSIVLIREKVMQDVERLCSSDAELAPYPARQVLLKNRCSEHDLIVISTFYTRVPISRLSELVGLTVEHTEAFLMDMVANHTLYAKMDRVDGLVEFEAKRNTAEVVEYWSSAVERCVSLLDEASHLITKERMISNSHPSSGARMMRG
eukprot:gene10002-6982_t